MLDATAFSCSLPIVIDGYFDWTFSSSETNANFHFNPQVKVDMKKSLKSDIQWYLGLEYDYWHHKYGLENSSSLDSQQNTFSILAKIHF